MRLGTCIAFEVAFAAGAIGGLYIGVGRTIDVASDYLTTHEARAATVETRPALEPLPSANLYVAAPAPPATVFDAPDDRLLAPLGASPVVGVKVNHGGTSLSLRLDFASGARAAFKPQQTHPQSDPKREIAAYRIDRLLGIGHVAPAKTGRFTVDELVAAAGSDPAQRAYVAGRIADEAIAHHGVVLGELSWWIPVIADARLGGHGIDEPEGMALWESYLQAGAQIPPDALPMVEQIATVVLFDVLIDNADRWTGYNTKASADQRTLYFMDNTLSFSAFTLGHATNLGPLYKIQVFPRRLVERMRALTLEAVTAALQVPGDPLSPLLGDAEIRAILQRRDHLVSYIDDLIKDFGEAQVLALP